MTFTAMPQLRVVVLRRRHVGQPVRHAGGRRESAWACPSRSSAPRCRWAASFPIPAAPSVSIVDTIVTITGSRSTCRWAIILNAGTIVIGPGASLDLNNSGAASGPETSASGTIVIDDGTFTSTALNSGQTVELGADSLVQRVAFRSRQRRGVPGAQYAHPRARARAFGAGAAVSDFGVGDTIVLTGYQDGIVGASDHLRQRRRHALSPIRRSRSATTANILSDARRSRCGTDDDRGDPGRPRLCAERIHRAPSATPRVARSHRVGERVRDHLRAAGRHPAVAAGRSPARRRTSPPRTAPRSIRSPMFRSPIRTPARWIPRSSRRWGRCRWRDQLRRRCSDRNAFQPRHRRADQ